MKYLMSGLVMAIGLLQTSSASAQATQPARPTTQSTQSAQSATQPAAKPLPAEQMLGQMLKPADDSAKPLRTTNDLPVADKTSGRGAVIPAAPTVSLIREGDYLRDRTGRLKPAKDGRQMEFTFDSDGRTLHDPPVILMPNLKLMAMESAANNSDHDLRFRITGRVTQYRGRNYVLLEKVVVVPETEQF